MPDTLGHVSEVTHEQLWGGETEKAVANFPVSGEPIPTAVAHWLARIKAAAAASKCYLTRLSLVL